MSISLTAPTVAVGATPSTAQHRALLLAADELLEARFNQRSFLIFTAAPQLELGDVCIFGTPSNLSITGTAYDPADEEPPDPSPGDVLSTDITTGVIWLTGYTDTVTLNRRQVTYDAGEGPAPWWVGTVKAQRFEDLGLVDVCVEAYTDPVSTLDTTFTWRAHWDKYGSVRIHNGNRFALTLEFEDESQGAFEIPPYGIVCLRRPRWDEVFQWDSYYLPLTLEGDPLTWVKPADGQFAASMELLTDLVEGMSGWVRFASVIDCDSTSREKASFTGSNPAGTDALWDWLWHKGKLLSVVLDKRDGSTVVTELQWNGIASMPDATWAGHVDISIAGDSLIIDTDATPPAGAGPTEWEHDLIPISTNLTAGLIITLRAAPYFTIPSASGDAAAPYTDPLGLGVLATSTSTVYTTESSGASVTLDAHDLDPTPATSALLDATLDETVPATSGSTGLIKSFGAIGRWQMQESSSSSGMGEWSGNLLLKADTSTTALKWLTWGAVALSNRRRFLARYPRRYMAAGEDVGGTATYKSHPQDVDVDGTTDSLAGPLGWLKGPISNSPIQFEGSQWTRQATTKGRTVWRPLDNLHTVALNINTPRWWMTNRDRILAGTFEVEEELLTWRIPRIVDEWNALANAINAVQEVYRADIRHLFKDPLPDDCNHPPMDFSGESPVAVPADWICGRDDDDDGRLTAWATTWGCTPIFGAPDMTALQALVAKCWRRGFNSSGDRCPPEIVDTEDEDSPEVTDSVNGYTFSNWKAFTELMSRQLFGSAGSVANYVYLTHSLTDAVFSPLGVPVMPPPAGERFDPVCELDSGATLIVGSPASGPIDTGEPTTRATFSAYQAYRSPNSSGSWLYVWDSEFAGIRGEGFRLIDAAGSAKRQVFAGYMDEGPPVADPIYYERNTSTACVENGALSPRAKTLWTSSEIYIESEGDPTLESGDTAYTHLNDNAWRSGTEIYSSVPVLVVGAPEPWCEFAWDTPFDDEEDPDIISAQFTVTTNSPGSGGMTHTEFAAGAVTPAVLRSAGWDNHGAYHVQVLQRTGVLRA